MKQTVRLNVALTVNNGKQAAFEEIARAMLAGTRIEPGALAYDWHFSADRKRCRLVETYVNAEALVAHLKGPVVQQFVPRMVEVSKVDRFEVYGDPGPEGTQMLALFGADIFSDWQSLDR
ncbi:MAG TPA: antibiotic biosynthesis monooxygenase [Terriglobales bacterium]|nr:antibiotic biosynthesis monooxygenase [Terriglobales bacterium]